MPSVYSLLIQIYLYLAVDLKVWVYFIDAIIQMRKQRHRRLQTSSLNGILVPKSLYTLEDMWFDSVYACQ